MDKNELKARALAYHRYPLPGKMETIPTKPFGSPEELALAYSPGVAFPCLDIARDSANVYRYTDRGNCVGVISNGTAVLGLGNIGPEAAKPVMEGKAMLFKIFAGLDAFDIEIDETDPKKFIDIVRALAPTFGGINLEDIKAPECFEIEEGLAGKIGIPVMHDDQHGTAVIVAAAMINAAEIQGKRLADMRLVVNGAGAAAIACTRLLEKVGISHSNIVMCDSRGVITTSRPSLSSHKAYFAVDAAAGTTLADALMGTDAFLGLSVADVLTGDMIRSMAPKPIVFALANPNPEISLEAAHAAADDIVYATGRSDYPNQINNVLGFPYIFRAALDCRASVINDDMKIAAAEAIAALARKPAQAAVRAIYAGEELVFGPDYILPKPFDRRLLASVSPAVVKAAVESGVAARPIRNLDHYGRRLEQYVARTDEHMQKFLKTAGVG